MTCISCGSSSNSIIFDNSFLEIPITQCNSCKLIATGESIEQLDKTMKKYYANATPVGEIKDTIDLDHKTNHGSYLMNLWKSHFDYCFPLFNESKNLLEIGPGTGLALRLFENKGFSVTGVEANSKYVDFINDKLIYGKCIQGFAEDLKINTKFDIIWLSHVFEHLVRPDLLLQKCSELLSNNGFIFIAVPDCQNPKILNQSVFDNASSYHYTKNTLKTLVEKNNLEIIKCESYREFVRIEGRGQLTIKKYFPSLSKQICPFYPFKKTDGDNGIEIRIQIRKKNIS